MHRVVLRHVSDAPPNIVSLVIDIVTRHTHCAGAGRHEGGENAHDGALARTIGAEQADDLATPHRKRNIGHRDAAGVALGEVYDLDHQSVVHAAVGILRESASREPTKNNPASGRGRMWLSPAH